LICNGFLDVLFTERNRYPLPGQALLQEHDPCCARLMTMEPIRRRPALPTTGPSSFSMVNASCAYGSRSSSCERTAPDGFGSSPRSRRSEPPSISPSVSIQFVTRLTSSRSKVKPFQILSSLSAHLSGRRRARNCNFFFIHLGGDVRKQRRAQIAFAGVRQHAEHGRALRRLGTDA
jgi:hypothetical protein